MLYTINKGEHRAKPNIFSIGFKKNYLAYRVRFTSSCRHIPNAGNETDWNKLFGFGFVSFWQLLSAAKGYISQGLIPDAFHHEDSARYSWRYNPNIDKIEVADYCYINKHKPPIDREPRAIFNLEVDYDCFLSWDKSAYYFSIRHMATFKIPHNKDGKNWVYVLGPYIGGDDPATQNTYIHLTKI